MITVEHLSKKYGKKLAVDDLSFTVPDGMVTGFLGPNGSGKSTTMRCILGLDRPTSGQALFSSPRGMNAQVGMGKNPYSKQPFAKLPNKLTVAGSILDSTWFTPARTGRDHLRVIARGAGLGDARVDECLNLVGLGDAAKVKVGAYSLGMKQRLGVATALLGDPQHLIFDEPINGLDPEGVSWLRRTIRGLAEEGRAVLVSSHLLSEMQQTADRLVVIGRGRMIGEYSMDEFLADGTIVELETTEPDRLADALMSAGVTAGRARFSTSAPGLPSIVHIPVDGQRSDAEVRRRIAQVALEQSILITKLDSKRENLEQRFLAATASAQEYKTGDMSALMEVTNGSAPGSAPQAGQLPAGNPYSNNVNAENPNVDVRGGNA